MLCHPSSFSSNSLKAVLCIVPHLQTRQITTQVEREGGPGGPRVTIVTSPFLMSSPAVARVMDHRGSRCPSHPSQMWALRVFLISFI